MKLKSGCTRNLFRRWNTKIQTTRVILNFSTALAVAVALVGCSAPSSSPVSDTAPAASQGPSPSDDTPQPSSASASTTPQIEESTAPALSSLATYLNPSRSDQLIIEASGGYRADVKVQWYSPTLVPAAALPVWCQQTLQSTMTGSKDLSSTNAYVQVAEIVFTDQKTGGFTFPTDLGMGYQFINSNDLPAGPGPHCYYDDDASSGPYGVGFDLKDGKASVVAIMPRLVKVTPDNPTGQYTDATPFASRILTFGNNVTTCYLPDGSTITGCQFPVPQ